jgi:hypothetical protein
VEEEKEKEREQKFKMQSTKKEWVVQRKQHESRPIR